MASKKKKTNEKKSLLSELVSERGKGQDDRREGMEQLLKLSDQKDGPKNTGDLRRLFGGEGKATQLLEAAAEIGLMGGTMPTVIVLSAGDSLTLMPQDGWESDWDGNSMVYKLTAEGGSVHFHGSDGARRVCPGGEDTLPQGTCIRVAGQTLFLS